MGILYRDILINNIIYIFKKVEYIILESDTNIIAKSLILLVNRKNSGLEVFLNNYDLITYIAEASNIKILTGI